MGGGVEVDKKRSDFGGEVDGGKEEVEGGKIPLDGPSAGLSLEPMYWVLSMELCCSNSV